MTTSEDGAVKWWDIRNMEAPVSMIDITGLDPGQHVSPCMMEYEPTIPSRLLLINSPDITNQRDNFTVYTIIKSWRVVQLVQSHPLMSLDLELWICTDKNNA